jgi:U3 small nucleolar RNA-associated protein 25
MQTPFLPGRSGGQEVEGEVDPEEVSSRVLVSRFDALKLERVIGSKDARQILSRGDERFVYA